MAHDIEKRQVLIEQRLIEVADEIFELLDDNHALPTTEQTNELSALESIANLIREKL